MPSSVSRLSTLALVSLGTTCSLGLLLSIGEPEQRLALTLAALTTASWLSIRPFLNALDPAGEWDLLAAALLAAALALAFAIALAGLMTALPGPISADRLALGLLAAVPVAGLLGSRIRTPRRSIQRRTLGHILLLLIVAVPLRFYDLGFSEFQGDEASVLHRAAAVAQGIDAALLAHRKGPGEILLVTFFGQLVFRVTEADARFPFAFASVLTSLALYATGRAMFGASAGLLAGLLWAVNGYAVAFGRIVQYHSVVTLLCMLALLLAWQVRATPLGRGPRLGCSLILLGVSLVFGFNTLVLGLPALVLLATSIRWRWPDRRLLGPRRLMPWVLPLAGALVLIGGYLVVEWRDLWRYMTSRVGQGQPFNNLDLFGSVSVRYLGLPLLGVLLSAGVVSIAWLAYRHQPSRRWGVALGLAAVCAALTIVLTHGQPTPLAIGAVVLLMLLVLRGSPETLGLRILVLWVLGVLALYAFLLRQPGTHWYELFLPLTLAVSIAAGMLLRRLEGRASLIATVVGGICIALAGVYPAFTFLPLAWPNGPIPAQALYRPDWSAVRAGGTFGFPHQDGHKAISLVQEMGYMPRPYQSNASPEVTRWYYPLAERCDRPRGSFVNVFSERPPSPRQRGTDTWIVTVRGVPRAIIRDQTATPRPLAQIAVEAPTLWFDQRHARLDRPLAVPRQTCSRPMRPAWERN